MITRTKPYRRAFEDARFAFALAMLRHKKKYTYRELADGSCIGIDQMRNVLNGKTGGGTSMAVIFDLAAFLGVSPAVFFPRGKE